MKKLLLLVGMFLSLNSVAMKHAQGTNWYVSFNEWSGQQFVIQPTHDRQNGAINRIIIGHMVSGPFDNAQAKLKTYDQNIAYNYCLGLDCKCYEGRPIELMPKILSGQNSNSCGVGLIANTCDNKHVLGDKNVKIDDTIVKSWGIILAHIALDNGIETLEWGVNIMGQNDLDPNKFPDSPGPKFYEKKDAIIQAANEFLSRGYLPANGDLY